MIYWTNRSAHRCPIAVGSQNSFYVCCTGALQAVSDGVLAFATYQKRPEGCDKKYLAKKGLEATRVAVPGTKSCKIWLIHRIEGAEEIRMEWAASLCWAAVRGFTLGPFQQHMTRYKLELAQCNGNIGMALLRTFIDSYAGISSHSNMRLFSST